MSWGYRLTPEAVRKLRDLGPLAAEEIRVYLETWIKGAADPRTQGKALRGRLKGFWRYRMRDWRILCRLEDGICVVIVVDAGHRSSVYD